MKKITLAALAAALFLLLSGCGGGTAAETAYDPQAAVKALEESAAFSESLEELSLQVAFSLYHLDMKI